MQQGGGRRQPECSWDVYWAPNMCQASSKHQTDVAHSLCYPLSIREIVIRKQGSRQSPRSEAGPQFLQKMSMCACMHVGAQDQGWKVPPVLSILRQISWDAGTEGGAGVQTLISDPLWPADSLEKLNPHRSWARPPPYTPFSKSGYTWAQSCSKPGLSLRGY